MDTASRNLILLRIIILAKGSTHLSGTGQPFPSVGNEPIQRLMGISDAVSSQVVVVIHL